MGLILNKILPVVFLFSLLPIGVNNADYNMRLDKRRQILNYKNDISRLTNSIEENKNQISVYLKDIDDYDADLNLITKFLTEMESEGIGDQDSLLIKEIEVNKLRAKLKPLQDNFKKKVVWLYKYGIDYETEILFTSKSLDDLYLRLIYLKKISDIRKREFNNIKEESFILDEKKKLLTFAARQKLSYISSKREDQRTLYEKKVLTQSLIEKLERENESFERQISRTNDRIREIEDRLFNLNRDFVYLIDQSIDYSGVPFENLQRRLIIPVQSVDIIDDFGTYVNPHTLAVSYNNGIDVSIARESEILCVADGVIEDIRFIPSLGNSVIVNHGNGYRTVYSLVKDINVDIGEDVKAGKIIGFTSENNNGQSFHFELWKDNQPQNPKFWFRRN